MFALFPLKVCHATSSTSTSGGDQSFVRRFSQNDIQFYDPTCKETSGSDSCGSSPKEIYWTALSNAFGPVAAAGIFGNIMNEGGFNPVSVEACTGNNPFDFKNKTWKEGWSLDEYLHGTKTTGVGSFGITSGRNKYFDFIESKNGHDLIEKYFSHPEEYSFGPCALSVSGSQTGGDALMAKIGKPDYNRLVSLEIEYMQQMLKDIPDFDIEAFKKIEDPGEAAQYFSMHYEKCDGCSTKDSAENKERASAAQKAHDEMQNYVCSGGTYKGQTFELTDAELDGVVRIAENENGCNMTALKKEISLMGNLYDTRGNGKTFIEYVTTPPAPKGNGWFAAYYHYYDNSPVDPAKREAARDILVNGNRTVPPQVLEHDSMGDISWIIDGDGNYHNSGLGEHPEWFTPGKTLIHTVYTDSVSPDEVKNDFAGPKTGKGYYVFHSWAGDPEGSCGDPFGVFANNMPDSAALSGSSDSSGSSGSSSSGSSSSSTSKTTPGKITLIGDSISVMSEAKLKEKFPDSFFTMVGSRHPTSGGVACSGDEGGLAILEKLVKGSGTIITQHSNNTCETIEVNSSMLNDTVVWELGTNSVGATEETLNKVIELVGNRKLYLVTPYDGTSKESYDKLAEMYRKVASGHDNVSIVDWNKAVSQDEAKYISQGDHVHPTEEGQQLLADLISQTTSSSSVCVGAVSASNFEWYVQWHEPWGNLPLGPGTIGKLGCGPTSFAMMASILLGHTVRPEDTAKVANENGLISSIGSSETITKVLAEHFNLEYDEKPWSSAQEAVDIINKYLDEGWMVHISGAGTDPFTSGGHYIGIIGKNSEGKWLLANSATSEENRNKAYDPMALVTAGLHYNIKAIRAKGAAGSSSSCADACEGSSGSSSSSGLTAGGLDKSKADALMEEYRNANEEELIDKGWIGRTSCKGGSLSNCVAFTQYFLNKYTTKSVTGLPNGRKVVSKLIELGFKDGGTTPKAYAVFSTEKGTTPCDDGKPCGHTGIVLSIDTTNNKIVVGEAGCSKEASWTGAHEYSLDEYTSGEYTYAYTDEFLQGL